MRRSVPPTVVRPTAERWTAALLRRVFSKTGGMIVYGARTSLFAIALTTVVALPLQWIAPTIDEAPSDSLAVIWLLVFVGAPLVENLVFIGIAEALRKVGWRNPPIVLVTAALLAATHWPGPLRMAMAAIVFSTMVFSYLHWRERRFGQRYLLTVFQHVIVNIPATVVVAIGR